MQPSAARAMDASSLARSSPPGHDATRVPPNLVPPVERPLAIDERWMVLLPLPRELDAQLHEPVDPPLLHLAGHLPLELAGALGLLPAFHLLGVVHPLEGLGVLWVNLFGEGMVPVLPDVHLLAVWKLLSLAMQFLG